uniref:BTB domain-containing protein n=1 Tax=Hymenolepis diminuta TaxID=6216 RepID=A0A0R3SJM2_HYMDI
LHMWSCNTKGCSLAHDVTFKYQTVSFSCHKSLFGAASLHFKRIFDAIDLGLPVKSFPGVSVRVSPDTKHVTFEYEEPFDSLEAIHRYLHHPELEMDPQILPSVYKVAKMYQFSNVLRKCGDLLARTISLENIGEICPLVCLSFDRSEGPAIFEDETSRELAIAVKKFMIDNADAIVSSRTGQLSARLFIDVLETSQSQSRETFSSEANTPTEFDDWDLSERVLLYCSRRVQEHEPLDEGNYKTFEDKSSRKLNNKTHASALETVTDEIRMTISESQLAKFGRTDLVRGASVVLAAGWLRRYLAGRTTAPKLTVCLNADWLATICSYFCAFVINLALIINLFPLAFTPSQQTSPQSEKADHERSEEVSRQSSCTSEANDTGPPSPLFDTDVETCLLAKTSLGVPKALSLYLFAPTAGSISIHLGKLQGRLVSVSVKRRPAPSGPGSSGSSSVAGAPGNAGLVLPALSASILLPPSPPPEPNDPNMMSVVIPSDRNSTTREST